MLVESAIRTVQRVRIALLVSIVLYVPVGEGVISRHASPPNPILFHVLVLIAITNVALTLIVRRILVTRAESALADPAPGADALNRWRAGYITIYALCEAIALYGVVLRVLGFTLSQVAPFYLAAFVSLLFFFPRRPVNTIG